MATAMNAKKSTNNVKETTGMMKTTAANAPKAGVSWSSIAKRNAPPTHAVLRLPSPPPKPLSDAGWLEAVYKWSSTPVPETAAQPAGWEALDSSEHERLSWGNIQHLFVPFWSKGVADALEGHEPAPVAEFYDRIQRCGVDVMWTTWSVFNGEREVPEAPQFGDFAECEGEEGGNGWGDGSVWGEGAGWGDVDRAAADAWDMNRMKPDYDAWVLREEDIPQEADGKHADKNADDSWAAYPSLTRLPRIDPPAAVLDDNSDNTAEQEGWHQVSRKPKAPHARVDAGNDSRAKGKTRREVNTRRRRSNWK